MFENSMCEEFGEIVRWKDEVTGVEGCADGLNDKLIFTINEVADVLGMHRNIPSEGYIITKNKPWFDKECRKARQKMGYSV